jgi:hypothetical protein
VDDKFANHIATTSEMIHGLAEKSAEILRTKMERAINEAVVVYSYIDFSDHTVNRIMARGELEQILSEFSHHEIEKKSRSDVIHRYCTKALNKIEAIEKIEKELSILAVKVTTDPDAPRAKIVIGRRTDTKEMAYHWDDLSGKLNYVKHVASNFIEFGEFDSAR